MWEHVPVFPMPGSSGARRELMLGCSGHLLLGLSLGQTVLGKQKNAEGSENSKQGQPPFSQDNKNPGKLTNNAPTCAWLPVMVNTGAFSRHSPQVTHTANSFIFTRTGIFFSHPWRYWPKTHSLKATPCLLAKQLACFPLAWYQSHCLLKPW